MIRRAFSDTVRFYEIISFAGSGKLGKFKKIIIFLQRGIPVTGYRVQSQSKVQLVDEVNKKYYTIAVISSN